MLQKYNGGTRLKQMLQKYTGASELQRTLHESIGREVLRHNVSLAVPVDGHASRVTRHTSHVTRHTSHVTAQLPHPLYSRAFVSVAAMKSENAALKPNYPC